MTTIQSQPIAEGLTFPEGVRWHDGAVWFSDMHDHRVLRLAPGGAAETVAEVPECPSGLGFLPDGRLLVVSMHDRRVLRLDEDGLHVHADLTALAPWHCNDMFVDARGRAYVGNFGDDLGSARPAAPDGADRDRARRRGARGRRRSVVPERDRRDARRHDADRRREPLGSRAADELRRRRRRRAV